MKIYLTILSHLISLSVYCQNNWELGVNKENIKIYLKKQDTTSLKEFKAVMIVNAPLDSVSKKILDTKNLNKWMYKTNVSKQIKILTDTSQVVYMQNNLDWPIKSRDHVSKVVLKKATKEHVIYLTPENTLVKENPNFVRIKKFKGFWILKSLSENTTQVTQQMYGDPESNVPTFIINLMLYKGPFETFKKLKSQLEKK